MCRSRQKYNSTSTDTIEQILYLDYDTWIIHGYSKRSIPITTVVKPVNRSLYEIFENFSEYKFFSDPQIDLKAMNQKIEDELDLTKSMVFGHMSDQKDPTFEVISITPNTFRDISNANKEAERIGMIDQWRSAYSKNNYEHLKNGYGLAGYMTFKSLRPSERSKNFSVDGKYRTKRISKEFYSKLLTKQLEEQIKIKNYIKDDVYTRMNTKWIQTARVLSGLGFQGAGVSTYNHKVVLTVLAERFQRCLTINEIWEVRAGQISEDGSIDYDPLNHLVEYYCTKHEGQLLVDKDLQPIVIDQENKFMNVLIVAQKDLQRYRQKVQMFTGNLHRESPMSIRNSQTIFQPGFLKPSSLS